MKYLKMLGLAVVAAAAVMAFVGAGSASATTLTCTNPEGSGTKVVCPAGTEIVATAESSLLLKAGFANITCTESTVGGKTSNAGSSTETVKGAIETLTFNGCNATVTVIKKGTLEIHTHTEGVTNSIGTVTGAGSEVTVSTLGVSCVYGTSNTDIGTLTGSPHTTSTGVGPTATFDINANLPKISGGFACASPAAWEGKYKITKPDWLDVD